MELIAKFIGKNIFYYDPKVYCTKRDFQKYIAVFNRTETLRCICFILSELYPPGDAIPKMDGVPLQADILCYLARKIIIHCDELSKQCMTQDQIVYALRMCYHLIDSDFRNTSEVDPMATFTKISYRQFVFHQKGFNNFVRNYYIYKILWKRVAKANKVDILSEIEGEIGVPYDWALIFAFALAGEKNGHFWLYDKNAIYELRKITGFPFTLEAHERFVRWCSGTYEEISMCEGELPPIVRYPIVATKQKPLQDRGEVFMIISKQLLCDKLTTGLYFYLVDRFKRSGKSNLFKEIYGYVFQEYVGDLLHFYLHDWEIIPEIKYKKGKGRSQDSIDWFILSNNKLIMIEVKQSSIFLTSKQNPSLDTITADLKKTVIKAVNQLNITEADIKSRKYSELQIFDDVDDIVKLVVINDPLYNANFLVKHILKAELKDLTFQIININDIEVLLSVQSGFESLFDVLKHKILENNEMDFNEYIYEKCPNARSDIDFLKPYWNEFIERLKT